MFRRAIRLTAGFSLMAELLTCASQASIARANQLPCLFQPQQPLLSSTLSCHHRRSQTTISRYFQDELQADDEELVVVAEPTTTTRSSHPTYDPVTNWTPPPWHVVRQTIDERITPLRRLTSPVFFSTNTAGERVRGLGYLPSCVNDTGRPLLIVGNHQLGGIDIWLIVPELIEQRHLFVRGLGHPVIFQDDDSQHLRGGPTFLPDAAQGTFGLYQSFGAIRATPKNLHRLFETKQAVLHFPGGAREAYHGKHEAHTLFWPTKVDFVRMAAKFNAIIVPMSAIGASDSVYMLADSEQLLALPLGLDKIVANSFLTVREAARYDERQQDEQYIRPPPLVVPKLLPSRHYFMFGTPFDTTLVDPKDRDSCRRLYQDIQREMKRGFDDLLQGRHHDPFKDSIKRFAYEQVTRRQAPTFSVKKLMRTNGGVPTL